MLDGSRIDPLQRQLLEAGKTYPPMIMITFGVNMDFSADITCVGVNYLLEKPLEVAGRSYTQFTVKNYCYDPSMAPAGKSVVGTGFFNANWEYWASLPYNSPEYCAAKDEVLAVSREYVEKFYPGFNARIEMMDVATPHTFVYYTGNRQGIFMTWQLDTDFQRRHPYIPKTIPGLSGLYLASMWTKAPGGIPGAAQVGREVVQMICKKDGRKFAALKP